MRYFWPMTVSGGMPTALDMAVLYEAAAGLASSSRSPAALRASGLRRSGASVVSGPSAGPGARASPRGRSAFAAGAAPTTAFVARFGSGKLPGRGGGLEAFPVGVVKGRSGPQRRRSWPRVKAARTRLPGWELAVDSGELGSSHLSPPAVIEHPRALGQRWTDGLRRLAPPRRGPSGPRGSIYSKK